jgi:hypothetical protein
MWRSRRDFLNTCASLFVLLACLTGCLLIVAFSWPDKDKGQVARPSHDAPVAAVSELSMNFIEIIPAIHETGTLTEPATLRR